MDKEVVVYILKGILLSYQKEHIWVSSNKVDEPGAYYTEWIIRNGKKYYILTHIYGILKVVQTILHAGQQRRHRRKNRLLGSMGEGKDGMIWENNIESYTLPYVI